jgi:hypothetical protein
VKRVASFILLAVLLAAGLWWLMKRSHPATISIPPIASSSTNINVAAGVPPTNFISKSVSAAAPPLLGEMILRDYASPVSTPENDLTLMAHLMDNFSLLVKSAADRPMSANEDWAAAFRGLNPAHERFLPDNNVALDAQGRLVDRWGTPLFFHALGNRCFDLRSAGPDKKLWTDDDIHRNADGSFRYGGDLNPPSLLESK